MASSNMARIPVPAFPERFRFAAAQKKSLRGILSDSRGSFHIFLVSVSGAGYQRKIVSPKGEFHEPADQKQ
jgi:hypothetical protein